MGGIQPKQARSKKTQQKIVRAAEKLFSKKRYQDVNTNMIAAEAGVSVGSFYNYFDDKKDVLLTVLLEFSASIRDEITDILISYGAEATEERIIGEMIRMTLRSHSRNAGLLKTVSGLRYTDPDFLAYLKHNREEFSAFLQAMLATLEERRGYKLENIETKAMVIVLVVEGAVSDNILLGLGIDDDQLAEELQGMIGRYLMPDDTEGKLKGETKD